MHPARRGDTHLQAIRGDFFDTGMHCPGALLQLQLTVFDLQLPRFILLFLQLDKQLPRLVLRSDQSKSADQEHRAEHCV